MRAIEFIVEREVGALILIWTISMSIDILIEGVSPTPSSLDVIVFNSFDASHNRSSNVSS
jgi:hypothetical protein